MKIRKRLTYIRDKVFTLEFATGVLCMGAVVIVFYFTAMVSGRDLFFKAQEFVYTAEFPNAGALAINDKVKILGVETGYVSYIGLAENNQAVEVRVNLRRNVKLPVDSRFTIQSSSVFGGAYININPGLDKKLADDRVIFKGYPPVDIIYEASTLISALKEDEVRLRENVLNDTFFNDIKDALKGIQLNSTDFNRICKDLLAGKGSLGRLLNDSALYDDARSSFTRLTSLLTGIDEGRGTLGKLAKSDSAYRELLAVMNELRTVSRRLTSSTSTFGKLTSDSGEIYTELRRSVDTCNRILCSVEQGNGSIGKFLKDEQFYNELKSTVSQLRAAIEDFREMAPVATFGSIALGAL